MPAGWEKQSAFAGGLPGFDCMRWKVLLLWRYYPGGWQKRPRLAVGEVRKKGPTPVSGRGLRAAWELGQEEAGLKASNGVRSIAYK